MTDELKQATRNLNTAFEMCLTYYDEVTRGKFRDNNDYVQAQNVLKSSLGEFEAALYAELKPIIDWGEQDVVFEEIKCFVNNRMFTKEFSYENCDAAINNAPKNEAGYYVITMIRVIKKACGWFNEGSCKLRWYCSNYEKNTLGINHKEASLQKQATVIIEDLTREESAMLIGRDATRFLFESMNRKGVISVNTASELSNLIGSITNYKSEQIRKNFNTGLTNSAKQKLKSLLESILIEIDKL